MAGDNMAEDNQMSLIGHLDELRRRIMWAALAILIATAVAFIFSDKLIKLVLLPSGGLQLNAFSIMDGFMIKWRVSLIAGIAVAFPIWAYQIYGFIKPGLYEHEQRAIFPVLLGSLVLFLIGVTFGYYLLYGMIRVLKTFFPPEVKFLPAADDYISFVIFFLLACGIAFQLPSLLTILVQLHILNSKILTKQRRIAYFILFVFAEIITPVSDPIVAPMTVMVPLIILYEVSIIAAKRIEAGREKRAKDITVT
jgi:sec-independent protein translocase protein TatC